MNNKAKCDKIDSFSMSALHWAASLDMLALVDMLLACGADVNTLDLSNQTPVDKAILAGHARIVRHFVLSRTLQFKLRDYLMAAMQTNSVELFRLLLTQVETRQVALDMNFVDDTVGSLLHYAVLIGNTQQQEQQATQTCAIIGAWLEHEGVEVNVKNRMGETPLHMAKSLEIARLLLANGADMSLCEITGKMPLFTCILHDKFDVCIEMLRSGCCALENIDRLGNSLLSVALGKSDALAARLILCLLEAGVALNERERQEWRDNRLVKKYPTLAKRIEYRLRNPSSLKELARNALRGHLNKVNRSKSIVDSVVKLGQTATLPTSLQDYVLLNLTTSAAAAVTTLLIK